MSNVYKGYILNENEVYGKNKFEKKIKKKIYASNCEPEILYWNTEIPKCFNNNNQTVCDNVHWGGLLCEFQPRTQINSGFTNRNSYMPTLKPCDRVKRVKTEFYLQHGKSSSCSLPYWMNR